jgi:NADH-quinone oxidoreductase subunit C
MFKNFYKFITFKFEKFNNTCIYLRSNKNYYFLLHNRLATNFFPNQLSDMFAYELFLSQKTNSTNYSVTNGLAALSLYDANTNYVLVYNLHNLFHNDRLFVFSKINKFSYSNVSVNTISELYVNANWLERELAEMYGLQFAFKKDLRNLMLQYGDTSAPFKKSFPTIGFRETSYSVLTDSIVQNRFDLQN